MFYLIILFIIAAAAGYKVISDVPALLHTPLMSGMNALSGISVIGALTVTAGALEWHSRILGYAAIGLAMVNVVAGFLVTHRMLRMFKSKHSGETTP